MDDSRQLQESNLAARQPHGATSVIQTITSEGLAQDPYVAARGGVEPATFRTEGTDNHHSTNPRPYFNAARMIRGLSPFIQFVYTITLVSWKTFTLRYKNYAYCTTLF